MRKLLTIALALLVLPCAAVAAEDMTVGNSIPGTLANDYYYSGGVRHVVSDPWPATASSSYTASLSDYALLTATTEAVTVVLPALATAGAGKVYVIGKDGDVAGTAAITIDGNGSETIMNGAGAEATTNTQIDASGDVLTIMAGSNAWVIIGQELQ